MWCVIIISIKYNLFSPRYSWKIALLSLSNNHSLILSNMFCDNYFWSARTCTPYSWFGTGLSIKTKLNRFHWNLFHFVFEYFYILMASTGFKVQRLMKLKLFASLNLPFFKPSGCAVWLFIKRSVQSYFFLKIKKIYASPVLCKYVFSDFQIKTMFRNNILTF